MWKPPQRIKHSLPEARWPSRDEAARSRLFSPVRIGGLEASERTWIPAMVPWRATEEGHITPEVLEWYARFARGRPGVIVVEATGVRDIPSGPLLRIGHDRYVPGLRELAETVRRESGGATRLFIQLIDFLTIRRRPTPEKYFLRHLEVGGHHRRALGEELTDEEVRERLLNGTPEERERALTPRELESFLYGYRERVTDTHLAAIRDLPVVLPGLFADAADRARRAGFDGVELHYAHAYTMASFLSARNDRADGFGGSPEARVRLPVQVFERVRDRFGGDFVVGCRLLSDECIEGGSTLDDAIFFCHELAAAGMDFLSLSRGGKFEDARRPPVGWAAYPYTGPSGFECMPTAVADERGPFGRNVDAASEIRRFLRQAGLDTPVVVAGGICTFDQAESILRDGAADLVAAARQSLADPDWFAKMRAGRGEDIRRCIYTNYCEGLDQKHKQVTCQLWDREGLDEPGARLSSDGKRRLTAP